MAINEYDDMLETERVSSGGNEYYSMVEESRQAGKQALQQSLYVGSKAQPDRQAKVIELSNQTRLPVEIVDRNFDEISKRPKEKPVDYDVLIDTSPGLAKWLQDPTNSALAHDDIDNLNKMERAASLVYRRPTPSAALAMPGELARAGRTGWNNLNSSAWHLAAAYGLTTPQEAAQAVAEANIRARDLRAKMPDYASDFSNVMAEEAGDVDRSFKRFRSSFDSLRDGHILKALSDYSVGGIKTVGETLDMIRAAVIRPRGLAYSTIENLAHSLPALITGAAGAKTGSVAGGAIGTAVTPGPGTAIGATAGGMIGFGAGSFVGAVPVEVGSWINETLEKRGFDMTDPDAILRAYSDPALMSEVRGEAERKGLTTAAVDAVFNAFAGRLATSSKPGVASKVLRGTADVGVQATGEATSEFAGQVAAKKGLEGASLGEAIQEGITSLGHSMGEVAVGATVQAGGKLRQTLDKNPVRAVEQVATKTDQAVQAQHDAQALMEVGQAVKDSKLAKRLPDKLQNLVEVATEGQEATSVFFQANDWDQHWQGKGLSPATAAAQIMGDGGKAYYEAKSSGAQIEIPLANYVAKVATTEHFDSLLPVARTRPDGMTLNEAKEFLQELPGTMDELAKEATATPAEQTAEESATKIGENVTEQLKAAGFDEATVGQYAKLWEAAFRTLGQRAGVDPMALFQKYAPQIQRTDIAKATEGQVLNQPSWIKRNDTTDILQDPKTFDMFAERRTVKKRSGGTEYEVSGYGKYKGKFKDLEGRFSDPRNAEDAANAIAARIAEVLPRAEFIGYQGMGEGQTPLALYNIRGEHKKTGSTVGADTLNAEGIDVPQTPTFEEWKANPQAFEQGPVKGDQTETPEFKNWFGESKVVDEGGKPLVVYHGAKRPDRIDTRFRKSRATSGPMAFFTDDPEIASKYATGKQDTSLEQPESYDGWFKFKPKGSRTAVDIARAWWHLTPEQREKISTLAPRVTQDDDGNIILGDQGHRTGLGGYDQHIKESRGNHLKALVEEWLSSGQLFNDEERFLDVLRLAGMDGAIFDSPWAEMPGVYPVFLSIKNPLVTNQIPQNVIDALERQAKRQRAPRLQHGADMWDKNTRDPRDWVQQLKADYAKGENSFVWSSIPDWVTKVLSEMGYDGIHDTGGKLGGDPHSVWIPFEETQVKSSTGNRGTFDPSSPNILYQSAAPQPGSAALEQKAIEQFGLTDDFVKAGFVLPDGRMLDFTAGGKDRIRMHQDVADVFKGTGEIDDPYTLLQRFLHDTGAVRLSQYEEGGERHVSIEAHGPMSQEQLRKIAEYYDTHPMAATTLEVMDITGKPIRHQIVTHPTGEDIARFFNGTSLFQGGKDEARGRIRFGNGRQFSIDLLKNADLSTFLHESGHFYLEVLGDLASAENATPEVKADYETILKWLGVESREKIGKEQHEKWARGFEAYLMEGKAPTSALRQAFARFRAWLVSIYRQMSNLNVELTPEVRSVFDRLLATQDEISAAEAEQGIAPLFADPKSIGMTDKEAEQYTKAVSEARQSAEEELSAKVLAGWKREQQAWWAEERAKVRAEVAGQVDQMPVYRALDDLQRKDTEVKLSKDSIVADFGKDRLKNLPKPHVYAAKGGLHHDTVAEMYGFKSGDELLTALSSAIPKNRFIDQLTDQRMRDEHPDMVRDPDAMKKEALAAVHNEKRSQLLYKELKHLASKNLPALKTAVRRVTRRIPPVEAVRAQAEAIIAKKKVRDIRPHLYQQAEARSAKEAVDAVLKGDFDLAFEAKQRELLNHELFRAANNAREEDDATVSYMAKFVKPSTREKLGKAGPSYLEQIDDIMERFDFRRGITLRAVDKRTSLVAWLEEQKKAGFDPVIPEHVLNDAYRKHYKEMTHEELVGVRDTVKNIVSMATLKNKLLKAKRMRELDAAVDEAVASIEANSKGERPREIETRLPQDEFSRGFVGFMASHRKFASFIRQIDGFKDGGVMWELFAKPMNEAGNAEAVMKEKAATRLKEIFDAYSTKDLARMYRKENIPEIGRSLTKMGQLMVALNWGNSDNRQKMMDGQNWTEAQVQAILARLDERDVKVVNQIWEFIDTYWPETKAISERVNGVAPSKVEAESFTVGGREFRGGYFPLKYDDRQAPKAFANVAKEAAEDAMRGAAIRATTRHGHREERVQGVKMPIRLDFGSIFEHVGQVIHDQTHYEFLIDMNRLLGNKRMQDAIISHYGNEVYAQLRDTMKDVAAGDVPSQSSFEKGINWLRTGTSIAMMGWSFMTAMIQPVGITQSIVRIGPKYVARGLSRWLGDATRMENTVKWIHQRSNFMRLRSKTQMREINEIRNSLRVKGRVLDAAENSYFWLITRGQMIVDVPTWLGAYEKAYADMEGDLDFTAEDRESRAIALADQAVLDSQGGGQIKDLADIQRGGPLKKLWTNFYSFFNTTYNLTAESVGRTDFGSAKDVGRLASDMLMLYTVPAILGLALREAFRGADDDEEWLERAVREQASYLMGTIVGLRELGGIAQGFQGYEGPAGTRFFTEVGKFVKQVEQGESDEAFWKALNKSAGILLHYPALQVERTVRGIVALTDGDSDNPAVLLAGPPRR